MFLKANKIPCFFLCIQDDRIEEKKNFLDQNFEAGNIIPSLKVKEAERS